MLFDIHGRFTLEVLPSTEGWRAYRRSTVCGYRSATW